MLNRSGSIDRSNQLRANVVAMPVQNQPLHPANPVPVTDYHQIMTDRRTMVVNKAETMDKAEKIMDESAGSCVVHVPVRGATSNQEDEEGDRAQTNHQHSVGAHSRPINVASASAHSDWLSQPPPKKIPRTDARARVDHQNSMGGHSGPSNVAARLPQPPPKYPWTDRRAHVGHQNSMGAHSGPSNVAARLPQPPPKYPWTDRRARVDHQNSMGGHSGSSNVAARLPQPPPTYPWTDRRARSGRSKNTNAPGLSASTPHIFTPIHVGTSYPAEAIQDPKPSTSKAMDFPRTRKPYNPQSCAQSSLRMLPKPPPPPVITPLLAKFYRNDLVNHVQNDPEADLLEKQSRKHSKEAQKLSARQTRVSAELVCKRSRLRQAEILATLKEQRVLYLQQKIKDLEESLAANTYP